MRSVHYPVKKERLRPVLFDKSNRFAKPDVRTVPLELLKRSVAFVSVVEVIFASVIGRLTETVAPMPDHMLRASISRPQSVVPCRQREMFVLLVVEANFAVSFHFDSRFAGNWLRHDPAIATSIRGHRSTVDRYAGRTRRAGELDRRSHIAWQRDGDSEV